MRIFMTGGTGLVGSHLCARLVERGDEVLCLTRDPGVARSRLPQAVELMGGDPALPGDWQDRLATCDAVVNLAGASVGDGRWTSGRKQRLRRSRLGTTENVARAVARADRPVTLVSASAVGYYGDSGDLALGENAPPGDGFLPRLCVEWEHTASQAQREGARVALLRIGVVLADDGGALPRMAAPFRFGLGGPLGSGRQYLPWIHIHDLVQVILYVLDEPALAGPINAVVPDPPTQRQFAAALGRVLGKPSFMPTPAFLLKLVLGEQASLLLASHRAVPNVLKAHGFRFRFLELEPALRDLLG